MIVGITGGIGSGKTTVCEVIRALGYPVFNSDTVARDCLMKDLNVKREVVEAFGEEILQGGKPDRKKLAELVFSSKEKLDKLNSIIHPKVRSHFQEWLKLQTTAIVFKEAAILIESGSYLDCDKIIVVSAPEKVRMERVMKRDAVDEHQVKNRMMNQLKEEDLLKYANFQIKNDDHHPILPQIKLILSQLSSTSC